MDFHRLITTLHFLCDGVVGWCRDDQFQGQWHLYGSVISSTRSDHSSHFRVKTLDDCLLRPASGVSRIIIMWVYDCEFMMMRWCWWNAKAFPIYEPTKDVITNLNLQSLPDTPTSETSRVLEGEWSWVHWFFLWFNSFRWFVLRAP